MRLGNGCGEGRGTYSRERVIDSCSIKDGGDWIRATEIRLSAKQLTDKVGGAEKQENRGALLLFLAVVRMKSEWRRERREKKRE